MEKQTARGFWPFGVFLSWALVLLAVLVEDVWNWTGSITTPASNPAPLHVVPAFKACNFARIRS